MHMNDDQFPFDIVGFDLDGTLLDTSGDLTAAVNHALVAAGRPMLDPARVKTMIGGGAKNMLQQGLDATGGCDPDTFQNLYRLMLRFYEANISVETVPFAGCLTALDQLDALGVKVAVVTNKFESLAVKLLGDLGMLDRFVAVIGGDTLGKGNAKPSPAPIIEMIGRSGGRRAAFVGDSIYDVMAARNAGVPSVAVSFGFLHGPVEELGADAVVDHFDALIPVLMGLGKALAPSDAGALP